MAYSLLGLYPIIPAADLTSLTSPANRSKGTAVTAYDGPIGKHAGMLAIRDAGGGDLRMVFATGSAPADVWKVVDNSATYTPA